MAEYDFMDLSAFNNTEPFNIFYSVKYLIFNKHTLSSFS